MTEYRLIEDSEEITVLVDDGGVACIRDTDDNGEGRKSTTDYYQDRITQEMLDEELNVWEEVGEGKMYWNDWKTDKDDPAHVQEALEWLVAGETEFVVNEDIWPDFE